MSLDSVKRIIGRAMTEPEFKELLFSDSAKALEGCELSEEETAGLKALSRAEFDEMGGDLEERISRLSAGYFPIQMTAKCATSALACC